MLGIVGDRARSRARGSWLLAACVAVVTTLAVFSANASAGDGYFCGTPGSPLALSQNVSCTGTAYHSDYIAMTANTVTGGSRACVARSSTPGVLTVVNISCTSGSPYFSSWNCSSHPCPGYGSVWKQTAGSGTYYGWYSYQ